jgi:SNF2 family DNA or RNA helicase
MTGTPNSNTIMDLWHQMMILDDGQRLGINYFALRQQVQIPKQVGPQAHMLKWEDKPGAEHIVASMISDITIRHKFDECMDIPPNFTYTKEYTMNKKNRKLYDEMVDSAILQLKNDTVTAVNAAALRTKLLQIASGAVYTDRFSGSPTVVLDHQRTELVLDLVEERQHSLVFFIWTHQRDQLVEAAKKRGISYEVIDGSVPHTKRTEIVKAYQNGIYQTLFLHPKTAAHGLTLTKGTATIWASPIYEPDLLKQGLHRIYRAGQKEKTETILVQARDTVEDRVYEILRNKDEKMVDLLTLLEE